MNENSTCPIWGTPATEYNAHGRDGRQVNSPRAGGLYFISRRAKLQLGHNQDFSVRARLTTWLNDQRRLGVDCPKVYPETINNSERSRPLPVRERADRLLRFLAGFEPHPGYGSDKVVYSLKSGLTNFFLALSWLESSGEPSSMKSQKKEIDFFYAYLERQGWIEISEPETSGSHPHVRLTLDGYVRLSELEETHTPSARAFVAMWFDDSMNQVYEDGIAPAVRDAGYEPVRIDREEHVNKIDDEILAEIRRSRFVVADFTHGDEGARGGVYYEAGFAHGIGIPVIFSCRKDKFGEVHFDTRQYNHIVWEAPEDLQGRLAKRISAVLGDGPIDPTDRTAG